MLKKVDLQLILSLARPSFFISEVLRSRSDFCRAEIIPLKVNVLPVFGTPTFVHWGGVF